MSKKGRFLPQLFSQIQCEKRELSVARQTLTKQTKASKINTL